MIKSQTKGLQINDGPKGRVAILQDKFSPRPGNADPQVLASSLQAAGYGVTMLSATDIADSTILNAKNFDCLIMPYGPDYPLTACDTIKSYLKGGGSFLSTGGYAFDQPCVPGKSGGIVPATNEQAANTHLNTRYGKVEFEMSFQKDQIGVFDACYHLLYTRGLRAAPGQLIVPASLTRKMELQGYAAGSLLGDNDPVHADKWGRHIPIVDSFDSMGRFRGNVGSIAHNYAGPYAGSSWAFFGVTNTDLFAKGGSMLPYLPAIVDAVVRKVYIHSLTSDLACYKKGEVIKLSCKVANYGKTNFAGGVRFRVTDRTGKEIFSNKPIPMTVKAGSTETVITELKPSEFTSDMYRVTAEMIMNGAMIDSMETGFVAYDPKVISSGLKLEFKDNYFHDADRPLLLSGTNETGAVLYSENETPLVWDRDLAQMSENGVNILRILHFSFFMTKAGKLVKTVAKPLDLDMDKMPIVIERKLDALVQLCQKHKVALFLTLHDWQDVELSDAELAAQRKFAKLITSRYKDVPGFMLDIQNEPSIARRNQAKAGEARDVVREWNEYLLDKYKTDEALKAAWKQSPPESLIGSIQYKSGTDAWDDMRTFDADNFRNILTNRWIAANNKGAKEGDPQVLVTVGFLQEFWAVNKLACVEGLDFSNMHSYNTIDVMRADLKLFDRRFEGKSFSLGEFGSVADHEKRVHGQDNPHQDFNHYLLTGHYVFGEGGSHIANWCWKDMDDAVFPWGIVYRCEGPRKDILKAFRNQSLLLRQVRPMYKTPDVFLVVPVDQVIGGASSASVSILYRNVDSMLSAYNDFGVIDDHHLDKLPKSVKTLVYPSAFSIPDTAYDQLKAFVKRGGTLYVGGDISYDSSRRRTKVNRLDELCGVKFVSENCHGPSWGSDNAPCINVETVGAAKGDKWYTNKLGAGKVFYSPYPVVSGFSTTSTHNDTVHTFKLPETDGSMAVLLVNPTNKTVTTNVTLPNAQHVELTIEGNKTGMARFDKLGNAVAVEFQNMAKIGDITLKGTGHFALVSLDGNSIEKSHKFLVLPFGEGNIDLASLGETRNMVVQTGDFIDCKWQVLSESLDKKVVASGETAFDIRIVASKDNLTDLGKFVASELTLSSVSR